MINTEEGLHSFFIISFSNFSVRFLLVFYLSGLFLCFFCGFNMCFHLYSIGVFYLLASFVFHFLVSFAFFIRVLSDLCVSSDCFTRAFQFLASFMCFVFLCFIRVLHLIVPLVCFISYSIHVFHLCVLHSRVLFDCFIRVSFLYFVT